MLVCFGFRYTNVTRLTAELSPKLWLELSTKIEDFFSSSSSNQEITDHHLVRKFIKESNFAIESTFV
jgi:hypothetical protein